MILKKCFAIGRPRTGVLFSARAGMRSLLAPIESQALFTAALAS
jgi:hypothetical protein